MNGCHETHYNSKFIIQDFRHRSQAIGCAGSAADDRFGTIQDIMVYIKYNGFQIAGCGCRNHNAFCSGFQMGFCFFFVGKETCTFQYNINIVALPGNFCGIFLRIYFNFIAIDDD